MPEGGELVLALERATLSAAEARAAQLPSAGAFARLAVSDSGRGIDPEVQAHLFEPFFTTKPQGKGTGLGLAIVDGVVRQHLGAVAVESAPGQVDRNASAPGGRETILLAEDEPLVRRLLARTLSGAGYGVVEAVDGADAVRKFKERADEVALCLFDVVMPVMNGREALEAVQRERPGARVLLASGYTADILEHSGLPDGIEVIAKPVTPSELLARVRAALDQQAPRGGPRG
jgi:CheY-like chemotaxis protein